MPLESQHSIAADSTISSSPTATSEDAHPQLKRAVRTYGKRKEEPTVHDTTQISTSDASSTSYTRAGLNVTAPPDLREMVDTSSPLRARTERERAIDASPAASTTGMRSRGWLVESDMGSSSNMSQLSPGGDEARTPFVFGWKAKLKEMDDEEDLEDGQEKEHPFHEDKISQPAFGSSFLLRRNEMSPAPTSGRDDSHARRTPPISADSGSKATSVYAARIQDHIIQSDSEGENTKDSSFADTSSSSQNLHGTPKSRPSSTPPTSGDEIEDGPSDIKKSQLVHTKRKSPSLKTATRKEGSGRQQKSKAKAPTKKDYEETTKDRARLAAQSTVHVPRQEAKPKYTLQKLFGSIQSSGVMGRLPRQPPYSDTTHSDPIDAFSSSPQHENSYRSAGVDVSSSSAVRENSTHLKRDPSDGSDDELPQMSDILHDQREKDKNTQLKKQKLRLLEAMQQRVVNDVDDEEGLEIVADPKATIKEEDEHRRSRAKAQPTSSRVKFASMAKVNISKQAGPKLVSSTTAAPLFQAVESQSDLSKLALAKAREDAARERRRKDGEWQKYGGQIKPDRVVEGPTLDLAIRNLVNKRLEEGAESAMDVVEDDGEREDDEDEDYVPPFRGSDSPEPAGKEDIAEDNMIQEEAEGGDDVDEDMEIADDAPSRIRGSRRQIMLDSDSEAEPDENAPIRSIGRASSYRAPASPASEDEHDKENVMLDEDKENSVITQPRFTRVLGLRSGEQSPSNTQDNARLFTSPGRRPLGDLLAADGPGMAEPVSPSQSFTSKLEQAPPLPTLTPSPSLRPLIRQESTKSAIGFSESEIPDVGVFALQPAYSGLFSDGTQNTPAVGTVVDGPKNRGLKRTDTLQLTQDMIELQPAFEAGDDMVRRRADAIFEKEQEDILEAVNCPSKGDSTELYVNRHGFLTQTKPTSPVLQSRSFGSLIDFPTDSQQTVVPTQARQPLRSLLSPKQTLSAPDSPEGGPRRRLRRADELPSPRFAIPASGPVKRNAFDELKSGSTKAHKKAEKLRNRQELGEFIEEEAALSDEETFGFGRDGDDDEETGEDLDKTLDVLMDDQDMDEETVAPELVFEKHREHLEADDQQNEDLHRRAIQGELRNKRRHGVNVDDSDDDEEDDEAESRAKKKYRKSQRKAIMDLAKDESTQAFGQACDVRDDDDEFAYLAQTHPAESVNTGPEYGMDEDDEFDEGDENLRPEFVSGHQIREEILKAARSGQEFTEMDTNDTSWMDADEGAEDGPQIVTVSSNQRAVVATDKGLDLEGVVFRSSLFEGQMPNNDKRFLKKESRSRNKGESRSVSSAAITGLGKMGAPSRGAGTRLSGLSAKPAKAKPLKAAASSILRVERKFTE